jgi:hypothetical protein
MRTAFSTSYGSVAELRGAAQFLGRREMHMRLCARSRARERARVTGPSAQWQGETVRETRGRHLLGSFPVPLQFAVLSVRCLVWQL